MSKLATVTLAYTNGNYTPKAIYINPNNVLGRVAATYASNYYDLTFSAALVASNNVNGNVAGSAITQVTYATSSDATMVAVAAAIAAKAGVASAAVVGSSNYRVIRVWPSAPLDALALTSFAVTSGASQATITVTQGSSTTTGTQIKYANIDNVSTTLYTVTESLSTVNTRLNAANSTDVHTITLTIKNVDGTTTASSANVNNIRFVQAHPDSASDSLIVLDTEAKDRTLTLKVDEAPSAIASACNA